MDPARMNRNTGNIYTHMANKWGGDQSGGQDTGWITQTTDSVTS